MFRAFIKTLPVFMIVSGLLTGVTGSILLTLVLAGGTAAEVVSYLLFCVLGGPLVSAFGRMVTGILVTWILDVPYWKEEKATIKGSWMRHYLSCTGGSWSMALVNFAAFSRTGAPMGGWLDMPAMLALGWATLAVLVASVALVSMAALLVNSAAEAGHPDLGVIRRRAREAMANVTAVAQLVYILSPFVLAFFLDDRWIVGFGMAAGLMYAVVPVLAGMFWVLAIFIA